jgi:CHAT domain-containing protein
VLHFATHGLIDEDQPERSGLALTPQPPEWDGLLQTREIFKLHLRGALVTLSACQTALGKSVTGEGIIGLSRAFFYAGANTVVASLWDVNDAATPEFMARFYSGIRAGRPVDAAMRAAKLAFIRSRSPLAHPYYWASFVVTGNPDLDADFAPRAGWQVPAFLSGLALLALFTAIWRFRRTPSPTL